MFNSASTQHERSHATHINEVIQGQRVALEAICHYTGEVNLQLSEARIRSACRELLQESPSLSGRQLCAELRTRYGAVGKTARVFRIWREETARRLDAQLPGELALLKARVNAAEAAATEYLKRAELAEFREQAHQDHWALEVDRLRQEVATLRGASKPFPV